MPHPLSLFHFLHHHNPTTQNYPIHHTAVAEKFPNIIHNPTTQNYPIHHTSVAEKFPNIIHNSTTQNYPRHHTAVAEKFPNIIHNSTTQNYPRHPQWCGTQHCKVRGWCGTPPHPIGRSKGWCGTLPLNYIYTPKSLQKPFHKGSFTLYNKDGTISAQS